MMTYSRKRHEEVPWPQQARKQVLRRNSMRILVWEVDMKDVDKKWEKSWQWKTKKLQGNVPSSTEIMWMGDGKKQPGINAHRTQIEGEVKFCLVAWKEAVSGKHDTQYEPDNGAAVL